MMTDGRRLNPAARHSGNAGRRMSGRGVADSKNPVIPPFPHLRSPRVRGCRTRKVLGSNPGSAAGASSTSAGQQQPLHFAQREGPQRTCVGTDETEMADAFAGVERPLLFQVQPPRGWRQHLAGPVGRDLANKPRPDIRASPRAARRRGPAPRCLHPGEVRARRRSTSHRGHHHR